VTLQTTKDFTRRIERFAGFLFARSSFASARFERVFSLPAVACFGAKAGFNNSAEAWPPQNFFTPFFSVIPAQAGIQILFT
jgi:hypothetical protein